MLKIYVYGCSTCGVNAAYVRSVQSYGFKNHVDVEVINSKYNTAALEDHVANLVSAGIETDSYPPVVVENGEITRLREWKA